MANNNPPKGRTRPSRLLNLKKASPAMKKISRENAEKSAFLRLPSEIRNIIYEYALGGCTLHITDHWAPRATKSKPRVTICREHEWTMAGSGRRASNLRLCDSNRDSNLAHLDVALLRCSRQIYQEAALIPYAANTFHVLEFDHTEEFFKSLMPTQRRAIEKAPQGFKGLKDLSFDIYQSVNHNRAFRMEDLKRVEDEYKAIGPEVLPVKVRVRIYGSTTHDPNELRERAKKMEKIILDGPGRAKYQEEERIKAKQVLHAKKEKDKQALERKLTLEALVKRKHEKDRGDAAIARDTKRQARGLRSLL